MDGYQAARIIRQQAKGEAVPIIALTANATHRDRRRCIAAGMNDIVTKPFSKVDLANALRNWLPDELIARPDASPIEVRDFTASPAPVVDFEVLEQLKLDMGDEFGLVFDAIQENIVELLQRLDSDLPGLSAAEVARLAHSLKSPSANIGAMHLFEMASEFEKIADQGRLDDAAERLFAMKLEYQQILKAFRERGL